MVKNIFFGLFLNQYQDDLQHHPTRSPKRYDRHGPNTKNHYVENGDSGEETYVQRRHQNHNHNHHNHQ